MRFIVSKLIRAVLYFQPIAFCIITTVGLVGPLDAKELFVATDGSDSVSYEEVTENSPWRTINHAVYNLKAGDTLFIREGQYAPQYPMILESDYASKNKGGNPAETMRAESGSESAPVTIRSYAQEHVVIDLNVAKTFAMLDNKDFWIFEDLEFINAGAAFIVGRNHSAKNNVFRRLKIKGKYGGDNWALIQIDTAQGWGAVIQDCTLIGPGNTSDIHLNTSTIYARQVNKLTIQNNFLSNAPLGIYFKHANVPSTPDRSDVDIIIENNLLVDLEREAMTINAVGALVRNNIFGLNTAGVKNNTANGFPGGDYNVYERNTFFTGEILFTGDSQSGDVLPGSVENVLKGNVFGRRLDIHPYSGRAHNTLSENNLVVPGTSHYENRTAYTLAAWQAYTGQEAGSIAGSPIFQGGDWNTPSAYKLMDDSPGRAAVNGEDIGANVDLVGPGAGAVRPLPPIIFQ